MSVVCCVMWREDELKVKVRDSQRRSPCWGWWTSRGQRRTCLKKIISSCLLRLDLSSTHRSSSSPRGPQSPAPDGVERGHLWPRRSPGLLPLLPYLLWYRLMCRSSLLNLIHFLFPVYSPTPCGFNNSVLFLIPHSPLNARFPSSFIMSLFSPVCVCETNTDISDAALPPWGEEVSQHVLSQKSTVVQEVLC